MLDHFRLFIKEYLAAIDAAGGGDARRDYLPLIEGIVRYTEATVPPTGWDPEMFEGRSRQAPDCAQPLDR